MKTNEHTSGPWSANLNGLSRDKQDAPQWTVGKICECLVILPNRSKPDETEANAHLIAAAPDMLAALKQVFVEMDLKSRSQFKTFAKVRAAIEKATSTASY